MSNKNNPVTGDRITNALKGDKEAYREGWEAIFGQKDMKKHVEQIAGETPHTVVEESDYSQEPWWKRAEDILDEITRHNEDMGLYDDES